MALSEEQLLLLDCFMYSDLAPYNCNKTLEDIIEQFIDPKTGEVSASLIEKAGINLSGDLPDHPEYLAEIMTEIYKDIQLKSLKITHTTVEYEGSIRAACFVDEDGNATVAFRGTGGSYRQWNNNFEGYGDTAQQSQLDAAEFINSLPYRDIDVTGHSNGGDQAMYVTIVCGDKVKRCVSFEGQGVSEEFFSEYADVIGQNKKKIKNICANNDFVSPILINVAGVTLYVESDSSLLGGLFSHGSYGIWKANKDKFDESGNFKDDAYVEQVWYCAAIHELTVFLAFQSDIPVTGTCLEFIADMIGVVVGGAISGDWSEAFVDIAKSLKEFAVGLGNDIERIIYGGIDAINFVINEIANWFNRSSTKKYVENNPNITVDTYKLCGYAQRLQSVNKRLTSLDSRIDSLYWRVGLLDLWNLMRSDFRIGYSSRINSCANYLNNTASDFERAEEAILSQI